MVDAVGRRDIFKLRQAQSTADSLSAVPSTSYCFRQSESALGVGFV